MQSCSRRVTIREPVNEQRWFERGSLHNFSLSFALNNDSPAAQRDNLATLYIKAKYKAFRMEVLPRQPGTGIFSLFSQCYNLFFKG